MKHNQISKLKQGYNFVITGSKPKFQIICQAVTKLRWRNTCQKTWERLAKELKILLILCKDTTRIELDTFLQHMRLTKDSQYKILLISLCKQVKLHRQHSVLLTTEGRLFTLSFRQKTTRKQKRKGVFRSELQRCIKT